MTEETWKTQIVLRVREDETLRLVVIWTGDVSRSVWGGGPLSEEG